jgi:preprotein translocase subunit YajC
MGGQSSDGSQTGFLVQIFPLLLMVIVVYLLIFRPQIKKQKTQKAMIDALKKGDKIVTSGGVHGTIVGVKEEAGILVVQVAREVRLEVSRGSVSRVMEEK